MATFTNAALATEINTDPAGLGYAALKTAGNDAGIAALINDPANVAGKGTVNREPITYTQMLAQLTAEATALTPTAWLIANYERIVSTNAINLSDTATSALLLAIFTVAAAPNSRAALVAYKTRTGSRAEVLWGTGTVITLSNISQALRGAG